MPPGPGTPGPRTADSTNGGASADVRAVGDETSGAERIAAASGGRYRIVRQLGRGGAAFVFLTEDLQTGGSVAMKVLRPDFVATLGEVRFQREIAIARQLAHPNILPILDAGSAAGQVYYTMPYIAGGSLQDRLRREKQLALSETIEIARAIADGLDYAHAQRILHRDIKPANILLDGAHPLIADFGIARAIHVEEGSKITDSSITIGTVEYMSPEHATRARDLDATTDVYALGCVVYELLAGEPPFTGPNPQAIIARHCHELPRKLRVIRPSIPLGVERALERALAKVPADRFASAGEFVDALADGAARPGMLREWWASLTRWRRLAVKGVVAGLVGAAGVAGYDVVWGDAPLDPNRIVVFPLHDATAPGSSAQAGAGSGEEVATYIGYALDGTRPLRWLDGWELRDRTGRESTTRLEPGRARQLSLEARAGFYIDGSIVWQRDSVTVFLSAFSVSGDSLLRRARATGLAATASMPQLGLRAIAELLPALLAPGGKVDLSALSDRQPTAIANFLQGEREYRRMQFRSALAHYEAAVAADSAFALAALRGAQAANWESEFGTDVELARTALRRVDDLPAVHARIAKGLTAYLTGAADSAIVHLQAAIAMDSASLPAWALLGEVASRLLPAHVEADSLARAALARARALDGDFAPTLLLLEEFALRDGDLAAVAELSANLRQAGADTTHRASRDLMERCVRDGPTAVNWAAAAKRDEMAVLTAAKTLGGAAARSDCAIPAFRALLDGGGDYRWGAFLGVQAQLAARGQRPEAAAVFKMPGMQGLPTHQVHLLLAAAGHGFEREAAIMADTAAVDYARMSNITLWHLASWEARANNSRRLRDIATVVRARLDSAPSRTNRLLNAAVDARVLVALGDSVGAIRLLRGLTPTGTRRDILWQPWESLGPERLLLAELLMRRGEFAGSRRVAAQLDATEPVTYPLYLRRSLELRALAADAMRDARGAADYRRRLSALDRLPRR